MKYFKIISDLLPIPSYSVIIICFFLPFLTIRCGENELASMSGFDIAKGVDFKKKMGESEFVKDYKEKLGGAGTAALEQDSASEKEGEKSKPIVLLIIPFFLAIIGLIIGFLRFRGRNIALIVLSLIGFLCLLIFGIAFKNSDELNSLNSAGSGLAASPLGGPMLSVKLQNAYYWSCFFFILIFSFYAFEMYFKKNFGNNNNNDDSDEPQTNGPSKSQSEKVEEAIKILENL